MHKYKSKIEIKGWLSHRKRCDELLSIWIPCGEKKLLLNCTPCGEKNIHLRQCLHFPAFTAVKYNKSLKNLHERIVERQAIKMKGYVAVQRKLLMLIFNLWKKNEPYKCLEQPVEAALIELD